LSPADDNAPRIILTSDWHLPPDVTEHTNLFLRFLDEVCAGADRLYILGDLFNVWVGPRHVKRAGHRAVLDALGKLAEAGTDISVLRGNRDFLLDQRTLAPWGLTLAPNVWREQIAGRSVRLSHGDELAQNDRLQKVLRAISGNFPASTLVKLMPLCCSERLAGTMRRASSARRRSKTSSTPPSDAKLRSEFEAGVDLIVIGHWHTSKFDEDALDIPGKTLLMLGESTAYRASYAELLGETIQPKQFPG
jgi:UDP-2,3-diacylglucosamine hydrolase